MKPGLAILPLEVWADVCEHPMITRQMLAQIANNNGDYGFTLKLQKLLHECGKQSLRFLDICSNQPKKAEQEPKIESERRALLTVATDCKCWISSVNDNLPNPKECEFPQTEMPENIKIFKAFSIRYLDDEVLDFLNKIKRLFNNVFLVILPTQSELNDLQIVLTQLLPMLGSIRGIYCNDISMELLEQHFPSKLALAKELQMFYPQPAFIPACLNWLSAPQDFHMLGPRCLRAYADATNIFAIVDAVRKQFLAATTQSAFIILLQLKYAERHLRADELTLENAATKEELTVRNANFAWLKQGYDIHYVEIMRNPIGAEMRELIEKRTYYENDFNNKIEANKMIWIYEPTVGRITKEVECKPTNLRDNYADGPSTSAKGI